MKSFLAAVVVGWVLLMPQRGFGQTRYDPEIHGSYREFQRLQAEQAAEALEKATPPAAPVPAAVTQVVYVIVPAPAVLPAPPAIRPPVRASLGRKRR